MCSLGCSPGSPAGDIAVGARAQDSDNLRRRERRFSDRALIQPLRRQSCSRVTKSLLDDFFRPDPWLRGRFEMLRRSSLRRFRECNEKSLGFFDLRKLLASKCLVRCNCSPTRRSNEATSVHRISRWRSPGVAARSTGAGGWADVSIPARMASAPPQTRQGASAPYPPDRVH
jgi:hypothetical protein